MNPSNSSANLVRQNSKKPSMANVLASYNDNQLVSGQEVNTLLRTKRSKVILNFSLEDFTRIHAQFSDKPKPLFIETPVYSIVENDRIKFKFRFYPSKHSFSLDIISAGTDQSAQLFVDVHLLDRDGKKFNFEFGRRIECQLNSQLTESLGNFIYDRDDLEKRRDKLFQLNSDKLVVNIELTATWIEFLDLSGGFFES